MDSAIITGFPGQLATYFTEFLLKNTDLEIIGTIRNLDTLDQVDDTIISNSRFNLELMDLCKASQIEELVKIVKPKYFINAAACASVGSSWNKPLEYFDVNTLGVIRILEAIKNYSPESRFLNFGSSEEWGKTNYSPQDENHPAQAISPYGASKIASREIIRVYRESHNLYTIQSWNLNFESEKRSENFVTRKITKGVARIKKALDEGLDFLPIELGNIDTKRDWSHVEDIVDGAWRMLNQEKYLQETFSKKYEGTAGIVINGKYKPKEYVLSSGKPHLIRDFIELAFNKAGLDIINTNQDCLAPCSSGGGVQINYTLQDGRPVVVVSNQFYRQADINISHGTSNLIKEDLGWEPKISFNELVGRMVASDISLENQSVS